MKSIPHRFNVYEFLMENYIQSSNNYFVRNLLSTTRPQKISQINFSFSGKLFDFFFYWATLDELKGGRQELIQESWIVNKQLITFLFLSQPLFNIDSKFHMLPSGELIVINVTQYDAQKTFRCRTLHSLTQDVVISSSVGRIQLTGK